MTQDDLIRTEFIPTGFMPTAEQVDAMLKAIAELRQELRIAQQEINRQNELIHQHPNPDEPYDHEH